MPPLPLVPVAIGTTRTQTAKLLDWHLIGKMSSIDIYI
jgi:hypothetical protein